MIAITEYPLQRGATLIVGLIMLVLVTLLVVTSFSISTINVQSVGNMQFREEAISGANRAIEITFSLPTMPVATQRGDSSAEVSVPLDINANGTTDYTALVARTCVGATAIVTAGGPGTLSSGTLGFVGGANDYMVVWDYRATINDAATGTSVRVHQGVRERLTQMQCDLLCPPTTGSKCS